MADDIVNVLRKVCDGFCCASELCDCCYDALNSATQAAAEIARLRAELASQTFWAELMAGNNCYCAPADSFPGVCAPCAYRQTMLQNKEARRG